MKALETRRYILEKAAPVFNRKGFAGTSLSDLEKVTGLTKGALYGNFADKETLAGEAFLYAAGEVKARIREHLRPISTYKGKLCALLEFFSKYVFEPPIPGGCPLLNTAIEADDQRLSMRPIVGDEIMQVVESITTLLNEGIRYGEFEKATNAKELAYVFFCAIEGAIMVSRVEGSYEPMEIVVNHCKNKLDKITCNKKG
jgi:Transcriptional regulator